MRSFSISVSIESKMPHLNTLCTRDRCELIGQEHSPLQINYTLLLAITLDCGSWCTNRNDTQYIVNIYCRYTLCRQVIYV